MLSLFLCLFCYLRAFAFYCIIALCLTLGSCDNGIFLVSIQSNLSGSNTDGSFTMANSNSFLSPYEILPLAQENKHLGNFSYFYHEIICCVYSLESPRFVCCV